MAAQWMPVIGLEDRYEVSDLGQVRSLLRDKRLLSQSLLGGYPRVTLQKNGKKYDRHVHRLVAEAFLGLRPLGQECNHKNCDKLDNRLENLEWVTRSVNNRHMINHCRRKSQTLTEGSARLLKYLGKLGRFKTRELAEMFRVEPHVVWGVTSGRRWSWV